MQFSAAVQTSLAVTCVLEHHTDPQLRRLTCLLSLSIGQLGHVIALVVMS